MEHDNASLTGEIIGAAIEVHSHLGPGLLESTYEECLAFELRHRGLKIEQQVSLPVRYKGRQLDAGYCIDIIVSNSVIVELKSVERLERIHQAQLLTYLRLTGLQCGLLMNFNVTLMKNGIKRLLNT